LFSRTTDILTQIYDDSNFESHQRTLSFCAAIHYSIFQLLNGIVYYQISIY